MGPDIIILKVFIGILLTTSEGSSGSSFSTRNFTTHHKLDAAFITNLVKVWTVPAQPFSDKLAFNPTTTERKPEKEASSELSSSSAESSESDEIEQIFTAAKPIEVWTAPPETFKPNSTRTTESKSTTEDFNYYFYDDSIDSEAWTNDIILEKWSETTEIYTTTTTLVSNGTETTSKPAPEPEPEPEPKPRGCSDGYLPCNTSHGCILENWLCDGANDCADGEDEKVEKCGCRSSQWLCNISRVCIPEKYLCDGANDCRDGEDEHLGMCVARRIPENALNCSFGWRRCRNMSCVKENFFCDGTAHCADGEDEEDCKVSGNNVTMISSNLDITQLYYNQVPINRSGGPLTNLTMCLWINPFNFFQSCDVLQLLTYNWSVILDLRMKEKVLYVKTTDGMSDSQGITLEGYQWHHVCILRGKNVSIYFKKTKHEVVSENSFKPLNLSTGLRLLIGSVGGISFSGKIADIRFYWQILASSEIDQLSRFEEGKSKPYIKPPLSFLFHGEQKMSSEQFRVEANNSFYVIQFDELASCKAADNICLKLGGQLPKNKYLDDLYRFIKKYSDRTGMNVTTFWMKNASDVDKCMKGEMQLKDEKIKELRISNESTHLQTDDKPLCVFPNKPEYYFNEGRERILFTYMPYSKYVFVNLKERMNITWTSDESSMKWIFYNRNNIYGELQVESQTSLIGRNEWVIGASPYNTSIRAIFSICQKEQFTCSSGTCISMNEICDFKKSCVDGSDEEFCKVGIEPSDTYEKRLAPSHNTKISLNLTLNHIVEIKMEENVITLNLRLVVEWRDGRLRFKNLPRDNLTMPVLFDISQKFWNPKISLIGAIDDEEEELFHLDINHGRVLASKTKEGTLGFLKGYEVFLHKGSAVSLRHEKTDTVRIHCKFDLIRYPFDSQRCSFNLSLKGAIRSDAVWTENPTITFKSEETETLPLYSHLNITAVKDIYDNKELKVVLTFKRKYAASIINTFLPCVVLEIIGMLTLLMPANNDYLNNRVILNLSCLIVMAAFFIQVNSNLPPSADPKLIDVWMFAHICLQALVFIVHILVIRLHHVYRKKCEKYHSIPKFGQMDNGSSATLPAYEIRMPRIANDDNVWSFRNIKRKHEKKPVKYHLRANTVGLLVCASSYVVFVTIFFFEITKDRTEIYDT